MRVDDIEARVRVFDRAALVDVVTRARARRAIASNGVDLANGAAPTVICYWRPPAAARGANFVSIAPLSAALRDLGVELKAGGLTHRPESYLYRES